MLLYTRLLVVVMLSLASIANASDNHQISLSSGSMPVNLAPQGRYLIDPEGKLSVEDVRTGSANLNWQIKDGDVPNFGFSDITVWAKYQIVPQDNGFSQGLIEIGYPLLDHIEVYLYLDGIQAKKFELGDELPFSARPIKHRYFVLPISLFENKSYELYIKVKSASSLQFPIKLWDQTTFWESDSANSMTQALYIGAMAIMVLYNLALFFYLRERAYAYYVALVLGCIGFQTGLDGYAYQLFFPGQPLFQSKIVSVSIAFQMFSAILFAKNFLNITTSRVVMMRTANVMLFLSVLLFVCAVLLPYASVIQPISVVAVFMCFIWLCAGIYEWREGNKSAKLFVSAWTSLVAGVVVLSLNKNGVLPRLFVTENALVLGTLGQVVLFSLALASRINQERDEKAKATKEALVANQRAVENLSKYQTLYEESLEGMFKCNQRGEFLHANTAMASMLAYEDVKSLMRSKFSFKEDMFADLDQLTRLFKQMRSEGSVSDFDAELFDRNRNYFWGSLSLRMVEDDEGSKKYFEGTLRDITERREKEKAQLEKKAAYEATQAKSFFLANMSHEIRTPLTAIIGFAESIRDGGLTKSEETGYVGTIIRSSQHLLHVINEILDLSKIEANKLDVEVIQVDLFAVIKELQSYCEMKARDKGLDFNIVYEFPLPRYVYSDQTRLKQVLLNLTSNALKFTEKGSITIFVFRVEEKGLIGFRVEDTGMGMTQGQQDKVFDAFTQADSSTTRLHGGTGLGLSIAKQLAGVMGGDITLKSEVDRGSAFQVVVDHGDLSNVEWVNDISEAGIQHEDESTAIVVPSLEGEILYAEDNLDNQQLISMLIKPTGAKLKIVENGAEAMAEALEHSYDLILMDIQMPVMSGSTATKLLRENDYKNPIVAITANLMDYEIKEYLAVGCNGYLAKPVNKSRFYEVLGLYLKSNQKEEKKRATISSVNEFTQYQGRVLIVDDIEDNRVLFNNKFRRYGIEVITASDGAKAVEEALMGDFDLVLMDLNMPSMGGEEAVNLLRQSGFQEPIVALTAEDDSDTIHRLLGNGFDGHLVKPLKEDQLVNVLDRYLAIAGAQENAEEELENDIHADPDFQVLIDNYVAGLTGYLEKMNQANENKEWEVLQSLAHQLKGSGGSFGFDKISETAKELELSLKENKIELIPEKLSALIYEIGAACNRSLDDSIGNIG